jgi:hypothetical protein
MKICKIDMSRLPYKEKKGVHLNFSSKLALKS